MLRILKPEEQEREAIKSILADLSEYYSVNLSDKKIEMYVEDLIEMGSDTVLKAVLSYRRSWNAKSFPLPAQLRKEVFYSDSFGAAV